MKKHILLLLINTLCFSIQAQESIILKSTKTRNISKATKAPVIDGQTHDSCWSSIKWSSLNQTWLGEKYSMKDFSGRYKLTWNEDAIYLLVQIIDDVLYDQYPDPLELWWDDDCVEIFIDADNSGGDHLYNHNAFAYHVGLDHNVVDLSTDKLPMLFNEHIKTAHVTQGQTTIWEYKIFLFDETLYKEHSTNTPLQLMQNQEVGFALAYCDNDGSKERENFIGSVPVLGTDKNLGYKTANIFETIILSE